MARLAFGGFEGGDTSQGLFPDQGGTATAGAPSTDVARTGTYSLKWASGEKYVWNNANGASNVARLGRMWFYLTGLPTADMTVMYFILGAGTDTPLKVKIRTTGVVELKSNAGTVYGTAGPIAINTWFCIEMSCKSNTTTGLEEYEARLNGTSFATATDATTGLPNRWAAGHAAGTLAAGKFLYGDDFALNDSSGASDTSWPGVSGRVAYLEPVSDNAIGANWFKGDGSAIGGAGYDSINNKPPVGVADVGAAAGAQLRNAALSTTQPAAAADVNLRSPTSAGVPTGSTITHARLAVIFGDNHAASMSNGFAFQGVSNPVIASQSNSTPTGTAGTWPSNWSDIYGTIQVAPTITLGTSPVARFRRALAGSGTQAIMVSAFGMVIEYTVPTQTLVTPLLSITPDLYPPTVTDYEIQDPGTVDDPLTGTVYISGETVRSIDEVRLYVNAPASNHLLITLKPPDGSPEVTIFDHRGSGADVGASSGSPLILRDDASTTLASGFVSGTGQTLKPENLLSTFRNESGGLWVITVTDTTTSTILTLTYALIASTGPKNQKKILKPKLLSIIPTLFAPTVAGGAVTLVLPVLSVTPTLFAPEVVLTSAPPQSLTVPVLSSTPELFAPSVSVGTVSLQTPLLEITPEFFPPTLDPLAVQLVVPLLSITPEFFGPTLVPGTVTLQLPLLSITPQFFGMAVNVRDVYLYPPLLEVTPELFAPTVRMRLLVPLLSVTPELFAPTLHRGLLVPLLEIVPQLFPPAVRLELAVPFLEITPELFAPTVRMRLVLPVLVITPELFGPQLSVGLVTLTLPLLQVTPLVISPRLIRRVFRSQVGHQKTTAMAGQTEGTGPGYQKTTDWPGGDEGTDPGHREYSNPGHFEVV